MEDEIDTEPRHLDAAGVPLCKRSPEGALLVEEFVDVTCIACLTDLACRKWAADRQTGGSS